MSFENIFTLIGLQDQRYLRTNSSERLIFLNLLFPLLIFHLTLHMSHFFILQFPQIILTHFQ